MSTPEGTLAEIVRGIVEHPDFEVTVAKATAHPRDITSIQNDTAYYVTPKLSNMGTAHLDVAKEARIQYGGDDDGRGFLILIKTNGTAIFSDPRHGKDCNIDLASPDPGDIAAQVHRAMKLTKKDSFVTYICHRLRAEKFDVTERNVMNPLIGKEVAYLSIQRGHKDDESLTVGMVGGARAIIWDNARPPQDRTGPAFDFAHPSWFDGLVSELRRRL